MNQPYSQESEKVDQYIANLGGEWPRIMEDLRQVTLASHPLFQERFKYKIPFYGLKKDILYFNKKRKENSVDIGFIDGKKLEKTFPEVADLLQSKHLKQVRHIHLSVEDFNDQFLFKYSEILNTILPYYEE